MTPEQIAALRVPFPAERVGKLPKGGIQLDYVGHGAVTERLLEVDPEWTWEPFALTPEGLPALDEFGNLWIKLTIGGVTRPGVGDGNSMKILIGDALRNAAMRFGVALDLWIRGQAEDDEKVSADTPPHRPFRNNPSTAKLNDAQVTQARAWIEAVPENKVAFVSAFKTNQPARIDADRWPEVQALIGGGDSAPFDLSDKPKSAQQVADEMREKVGASSGRDAKKAAAGEGE